MVILEFEMANDLFFNLCFFCFCFTFLSMALHVEELLRQQSTINVSSNVKLMAILTYIVKLIISEIQYLLQQSLYARSLHQYLGVNKHS